MVNKKTFVSWKQINELVEALASTIDQSKYLFLFGIPRGGVHVAQELSKILGLPLVSELRGKVTLVVDDVADSGETLALYKDYDSAVLHLKSRSKSVPSYYVEATDEWIVYPWEVIDGKDEGITSNVTRLLEYIGEDPKREGLQETPKRFEKAWKFWTKGYKENPKDIMKCFKNPGVDQLIIVPKIDFYSLCEHHLTPFYGQIHIGYVPNGKVLGVSKFARLIEVYTRRLQIQERITQQIADDLMRYLKPVGVGVVAKAVHLCMRSRGIEKQNAEMITSAMFGNFREKPSLRQEFLSLIV